MDEAFSGLRERPFPSTPSTAAYFPAQTHEHAIQQIDRCIQRAEGLAVIVGPAGTGKSLILQTLAEHFRDHFHVALLASSAIRTRRALLQSVLFELGLPYRGMEEGELRLSLIDHLQPSRECPNGMLLLVDEAHTLPIRLLEELRLLTNLVREGTPRVRLVLAGSAVLEERLTSPKLESFQQRIVARCYLEAMSSEETDRYISAEVRRCGGHPDLSFPRDARRAVYLATMGIPRLVNQLCDHAVTLAVSGPLSKVTSALIQQAWSELQQLPAPWHNDAEPAAAIEFGALGDEEQAAADSLSLSRDSLDDEPAGLNIVSPETAESEESIVPSAEALFGGDRFHEEETVIDRSTAEQLSRSQPVKLPSTAPLAAYVSPVSRKKATEPVAPAEPDFDAALDPVYPESARANNRPAGEVLAIDSSESGLKGPHSPNSRTASRFRSLFANLSGKKS